MGRPTFVRIGGTLNTDGRRDPCTMATRDDGRNHVKTAGTMFDIIESLQAHDGTGISELAEELGLAKSTVHRHLSTLHEMEYVVREGDTYYLGLQFLNLGEYVRNRKELYVLAKAKVDEIARETEERAQFIVEEHGYGVYVHRVRGRHAVKTDPGIGKRMPIHAISAGKAILAHMPRKRVEEIVERRGLPPITPHTITDEEELFEELEQVRGRGYAINDEETVEGLRAVGVPIHSRDGKVTSALSVSGPTHRVKGEWLEQDLLDLLLGTANELELNVAHGDFLSPEGP